MDKREKAQRADALLKDDVLQAAFDGVLLYHTSVLTRVSATDEQVLEARRMVLALNEVKSRLHRYVSTGDILAKKDQDREHD
jgi:hypothetical protein|tara:strand:+ start:750 stop:995 length:246 start_codon:yes stop_codon:yes gene_type:complete